MAIAVIAVVRALVYDPFADVACRGLCGPSPVVITTNLGLAHVLGAFCAVGTVFVAFSAGRAVIRARHATRRDARCPLAGLAIAGAALLLGIDAAVRLASDRVGKPARTTAGVLTVVFSSALLVSVALILSALDPLRARHAVGRVARLLTGSAGTTDPQEILREGFGDPGLLVGYWVDGVGYVDEHFDALPLPPPDWRIELTAHGCSAGSHHPRPGRHLAGGNHSAHRLASAAGDQEQEPDAELNRNIAEVDRSRQRIVDAVTPSADASSATCTTVPQQRLLALSFELRRGERAALAAGDVGRRRRSRSPPRWHRWRSSSSAVSHTASTRPCWTVPGSMTRSMALASSEGRAVTLNIDVDGPLPASVESATYGVLAATITDESSAAAPAITVRRDGERIALTIDHVRGLSEHAIDRAEAAGGRWSRTERGFEVALPCAW